MFLFLQKENIHIKNYWIFFYFEYLFHFLNVYLQRHLYVRINLSILFTEKKIFV